MWPTPCASEARQGLQIRRPGTKGKQQSLSTAVRLFPTPKAQNSRGSGEKHGDGGPSLDVVAGGQLNPDWVAWLMGYPIGWADVGPQNQQESRESQPESRTE